MIKQRDIGNFTLNIYRIVRIILVDYSSRRKAKRHRTHWRQNRITTELCVWENLRWQYIMHKIEASCMWCATKSFWKIKKSLFRTHAPHTRTHPLNDSNPEGNYTKLNATQNRFVHFYFAIYVSNGIMYNIFFALLITTLTRCTRSVDILGSVRSMCVGRFRGKTVSMKIRMFYTNTLIRVRPRRVVIMIWIGWFGECSAAQYSRARARAHSSYTQHSANTFKAQRCRFFPDKRSNC